MNENNSQMDKERFKALCALYFFNTIQPDELKELKLALSSGDKKLQEIFSETKKSIDRLSLTVDLADHLGEINGNILPKVKDFSNRKVSTAYKKYHHEIASTKINIISAISILLLISLLILTFYLYNIQNKNIKLNNNIKGYNSLLENDSRIFGVLSSKQIDIINLAGQDINPSGYGKIFWSPFTNEAVLQLSNLPPIVDSEVYRLWLVKKDQYYVEKDITSDLLNTSNFYFIKDLPINNNDTSYTFLLTLEPRKGIDKPVGTIFLRGSSN